jgi:hypothetical protein
MLCSFCLSKTTLSCLCTPMLSLSREELSLLQLTSHPQVCRVVAVSNNIYGNRRCNGRIAACVRHRHDPSKPDTCMYVRMYVRMYVCMYVCLVYAHIQTSACSCIQSYKHVCVLKYFRNVRIHVYMHVCTYIYICTHLQTHIHKWINIIRKHIQPHA